MEGVIKGQGMAAVGPHGALLRSAGARPRLTMFVIRRDARRGMYALYHYALLPITYLVTPCVYRILCRQVGGGKKLRDFCGPVMGLTRGTITMQPARTRVYIRVIHGKGYLIV